nr:RnfH family protein [Psychrobacter sp. PraFG1]UNK04976.1 RnfH family protein [Psychrobacter sp. PraFG1]
MGWCVFSKKLLSYELQAHDRIEIYRPLTIDPMRKRKKERCNKLPQQQSNKNRK